MKISLSSSSSFILAIGMMAVLLAGCLVATDNGYDYDDGGYYQPYGVYYGSWGPDYDVAPFHHHGGEHHRFEGGRHAPPHTYRSAPAFHSIPSLPSAGRSGGHRR